MIARKIRELVLCCKNNSNDAQLLNLPNVSMCMMNEINSEGDNLDSTVCTTDEIDGDSSIPSAVFSVLDLSENDLPFAGFCPVSEKRRFKRRIKRRFFDKLNLNYDMLLVNSFLDRGLKGVELES